jgi:hypothetical protein
MAAILAVSGYRLHALGRREKRDAIALDITVDDARGRFIALTHLGTVVGGATDRFSELDIEEWRRKYLRRTSHSITKPVNILRFLRSTVDLEFVFHSNSPFLRRKILGLATGADIETDGWEAGGSRHYAPLMRAPQLSRQSLTG